MFSKICGVYVLFYVSDLLDLYDLMEGPNCAELVDLSVIPFTGLVVCATSHH